MKAKTTIKASKSWENPKKIGFHFDLIKAYNHELDNENAIYTLSEQTLADLNFQLFFKFLDRTSSPIGQQYLYHHTVPK